MSFPYFSESMFSNMVNLDWFKGPGTSHVSWKMWGAQEWLSNGRRAAPKGRSTRVALLNLGLPQPMELWKIFSLGNWWKLVYFWRLNWGNLMKNDQKHCWSWGIVLQVNHSEVYVIFQFEFSEMIEMLDGYCCFKGCSRVTWFYVYLSINVYGIIYIYICNHILCMELCTYKII